MLCMRIGRSVIQVWNVNSMEVELYGPFMSPLIVDWYYIHGFILVSEHEHEPFFVKFSTIGFKVFVRYILKL